MRTPDTETMTAPLPPLPIGDRFKDTKQFRYLGAGAGDSLYECWQSAIEAFAKLAVRQALCQLADDIDTWPTVAKSSGFYSDEIRRIAKERYK